MTTESIPKRQKLGHSIDTAENAKNAIDETTGLSRCFQKVTCTLYVSLAPMYTASPAIGIKSQHLNPLLLTWYSAVGGVVLAYDNLRLLGQDESNFYDPKWPHEEEEYSDEESKPLPKVLAKVVHESPFAFSWIAVTFLVWRPQTGDLVEGIINLQAPSHISLLIHDVFHASIRREALPDDWEFVYYEADEAYYEGEDEAATAVEAAAESLDKDAEKESKADDKGASKSIGYWVDGSGEKITEAIRFTIRKVMVTGRLISVQGTLRADGSTRKFDSTKTQGSYGNDKKNGISTAAKGTHIRFDDDDEPRLNKRKVFTDDDEEIAAISDKISKDIAESTKDEEPTRLRESVEEEEEDNKIPEAVSSAVNRKSNDEDEDEALQYAEDSDSGEESD